MNKLLAMVVVSGFVLAGCSADVTKGEATPELVISTLKKAGIPIKNEVIYTAENDLNHMLGRPNQYVAKANWADSRVSQNADALTGGSVEIFKNESDLKSRMDYVEKVGKEIPTVAQYQFKKGWILIRLDKILTPNQASEYEKALNSL